MKSTVPLAPVNKSSDGIPDEPGSPLGSPDIEPGKEEGAPEPEAEGTGCEAEPLGIGIEPEPLGTGMLAEGLTLKLGAPLALPEMIGGLDPEPDGCATFIVSVCRQVRRPGRTHRRCNVVESQHH